MNYHLNFYFIYFYYIKYFIDNHNFNYLCIMFIYENLKINFQSLILKNL